MENICQTVLSVVSGDSLLGRSDIFIYLITAIFCCCFLHDISVRCTQRHCGYSRSLSEDEQEVHNGPVKSDGKTFSKIKPGV